MNKSLKAFLMGYLLFKVNDRYYLTYNRGLQARRKIMGDFVFMGWNPLHLFDRHPIYGLTYGWVGFSQRLTFTNSSSSKREGK